MDKLINYDLSSDGLEADANIALNLYFIRGDAMVNQEQEYYIDGVFFYVIETEDDITVMDNDTYLEII